MKKLIVFWVLSCGLFATAQEVNKEFTKLLFNEQFDQVDKNWNSTFNADNLFIAQNGFYELYRRSKKSGYYLFPARSEQYSAFQIDVSLVFSDHTNKKQSAGILMMADVESGGGISVEINRKKEYRIVRVYKDRQTPISGNGSGWMKASSAITRVENLITVKTYDKVYDLYINGIFIQSFTDIELGRGKIGIYVGPDSKVKFDFLKILGEEKKDLQDMDVTDIKGEEQAFTKIIIVLKEQINKKEKEIDECATRLKLCESSGMRGNADTSVLNERNRLLARLTVLQEENDELGLKLMRLEEELEELKDFKTGVEKGSDGDIVINLTNMVSNQKSTIEGLEKSNKSLNDENNGLYLETKELTKQLGMVSIELGEQKSQGLKMKYLIDSLKKQILLLRDSISKKQTDSSGEGTGMPQKELSEEEKLQQMIEKEREERRKRREEEERKRKEDAEKKNNGNGG